MENPSCYLKSSLTALSGYSGPINSPTFRENNHSFYSTRTINFSTQSVLPAELLTRKTESCFVQLSLKNR